MENKLEFAKFEQLVEHAKKVNKKFNKNLINIEETSHEYVVEDNTTRKIVTFNMTFDTIVNDWKVVAKKSLVDRVALVDIFTEEDTNEKTRETLRNRDLHCDHCHTTRAKKNLYMIKNIKTNEVKYVGKACMKEFIGISVNKFFSEEKEIKRMMNFDDFFTSVEPYIYISVKNYLTIAYKLAKDGEEYINRNLANYEGISSTNDKIMDKLPTCNEENPEVEEIIKWFVETNKNSNKDFTQNVIEILKEDYVTIRLASRLAFIPFSYMKYLAKMELKRRREEINAQMANEYLPFEVDEKVNLSLKLLKYTYFEREAYSYYDSGITYVYTFIDDNGRVVVWKTSKGSFAKEENLNKKYNVSGRIKEFTEYNDVKQTVLTRCRFK